VIDVTDLSKGFTFINKNLFPILFPGGSFETSLPDMPDSAGMPAHGFHFLQWTSSQHDKDWHNMPRSDRIVVLKRLAALEKKLLVIADSSLFPLVASADLSLVAPTKNIPFIGSPTTLACIINYLVQELASRDGSRLEEHQRRLEQIYRENDVLFNLKAMEDDAL
jgi:hypothetical protein